LHHKLNFGLDALIIKKEPTEIYDGDENNDENVDDDGDEGTLGEEFLINAMGAFNGMSVLFYPRYTFCWRGNFKLKVR